MAISASSSSGGPSAAAGCRRSRGGGGGVTFSAAAAEDRSGDDGENDAASTPLNKSAPPSLRSDALVCLRDDHYLQRLHIAINHWQLCSWDELNDA